MKHFSVAALLARLLALPTNTLVYYEKNVNYSRNKFYDKGSRTLFRGARWFLSNSFANFQLILVLFYFFRTPGHQSGANVIKLFSSSPTVGQK